MTQEKILEGNKLIAEFDGWEDTGVLHPYGRSQFNLYQHPTHAGQYWVEKMQYHSSWDWLMPVVKKCSESFEHHQYDSEEYYHITEEIFHPDYSLSEFMDADIEAVYSRVVTYIKWYNQNKEK